MAPGVLCVHPALCPEHSPEALSLNTLPVLTVTRPHHSLVDAQGRQSHVAGHPLLSPGTWGEGGAAGALHVEALLSWGPGTSATQPLQVHIGCTHNLHPAAPFSPMTMPLAPRSGATASQPWVSLSCVQLPLCLSLPLLLLGQGEVWCAQHSQSSCASALVFNIPLQSQLCTVAQGLDLNSKLATRQQCDLGSHVPQFPCL